jgi:hypothetical protein
MTIVNHSSDCCAFPYQPRLRTVSTNIELDIHVEHPLFLQYGDYHTWASSRPLSFRYRAYAEVPPCYSALYPHLKHLYRGWHTRKFGSRQHTALPSKNANIPYLLEQFQSTRRPTCQYDACLCLASVEAARVQASGHQQCSTSTRFHLVGITLQSAQQVSRRRLTPKENLASSYVRHSASALLQHFAMECLRANDQLRIVRPHFRVLKCKCYTRHSGARPTVSVATC